MGDILAHFFNLSLTFFKGFFILKVVTKAEDDDLYCYSLFSDWFKRVWD